MSGCWTDYEVDNPRLVINNSIYYSDTRNFGTFTFGMTRSDTQDKLNSLGYDLLNDSHDSTEIAGLVIKKNQTLAQILMNQKIFAGVGNYVKAEALYRARLSPHRTGKSLGFVEALRLVGATQNVLRESYESKPRAFVNYEECGKDFEKVVYRRNKDPLGNEVVGEETKDKRTTWWVPALQV